jgi:hypothetical protein
MQEDGTTNLTLTTPGSVDSSSRNLQISSECSRQITTVTGTNEVALWAHQPYIVPFSKLPHSVTGAQSLHFLIHSQPRDPGPTIYTFTFPRSSSELGPGEHFSHITFRYACSCSKLSNSCHMFFIIRYCSRRVFGFHVCRYLVIKVTQPLQVYVRHWHVIIPSVNQLHLPVTPSDIYL